MPVEMIEIDQAHVGLRVFAVSEDTPILQLADQRLHHRMVGAHHSKAVERDILDEGAKRILHRIECLEMVEVLRIDIRDDRDIGRQFQKRPIGFIGLNDHPVSAAEPRIGAVCIDDPAIDHRRIEAAGVKQRCNKRRRRGLAVRARNRDAAFQPHQFGEHLGAAHHRQALGTRSNELRVVTFDCGGDDDHVGAVYVFRLVTDGDFDAFVTQAIDVGTVRDVRPRHVVAEVGQHLGDPAHANAADADKMHRTDVARQLHKGRP